MKVSGKMYKEGKRIFPFELTLAKGEAVTVRGCYRVAGRPAPIATVEGPCQIERLRPSEDTYPGDEDYPGMEWAVTAQEAIQRSISHNESYGNLTDANRAALEQILNDPGSARFEAEQVLSFDGQVDYTSDELNASATELLAAYHEDWLDSNPGASKEELQRRI